MTSFNNKTRPTFLVILAFAIVYIVWGSTYYFIQVAVKSLPPMMLGAMRFLAAGGLMMVWCLIQGERMGTRSQVITSIITGLMMLLGGTGAVIWAEKWLPSSLVAILISSSPFWFVLLDFPKWKENLISRSVISGLIIGFIGVNMMFYDKISEAFKQTGNNYELAGLGILLFGTISWTGGSLISKYRAAASANVTSALQMLAAGIAFALGSLILGEYKGFQWSGVPADAWWSVIYLIVFGSIVAYSAYIWLLRVRPAAQVSTYAYVNPLIAVLLGVSLGGEQITIIQIGGLLVILAGVLLINLAKYKKMKK
ncbi:MAG: EamA family transporter [Deltaproteobacteria bacterium]